MIESDVPHEVADDDGRVWTLDGSLGGGGQGDVYTVRGHPLVVKILRDKQRETPATLRARLAAVRRLPVQDLPVARPIALLRPPLVGYVMRLVDGVVPLAALLASHRVANLAQYYLDSGGLCRRLRVLARVADVLEHLHSRAIVYGDLSPANVLISADVDSAVTWLIDLDNLRISSAPGLLIMTRTFAAPEIERGTARAPDTLTDAHALAVVSYEVLTSRHPLLGGTRFDADPSARAQALRGEIPWIAHPDDRSNERLGGLPWEMVLTKRAFDLARRTFEAGLTEPSARATTGEWARELRWAAGMCLACPHCEQTFLAGSRECPWCGADRPRMVLVSVGVCAETGDTDFPKRMPRLAGAVDDVVAIRRFEAFADRDMTSQDELVATVRLDRDRVTYEPRVAGTRFGQSGSEPRALAPGEAVRIAARGEGVLPWHIHFGEPGTLHRIARVQLFAGADA